MSKALRTLAKNSILNIMVIIFSLFFLFACARVQPVQESAPPAEPKVEETRKEEVPDRPLPPEPPPAKTTPAPPPEPPKVTQPPPPPPSAPPPLRMTKVVWDSVNLREGPGMNHKVIGSVKKGTPLAILEVKGSWLRVRLEDGREAWVSRSATSEAPASTPSSSPPKPKPM